MNSSTAPEQAIAAGDGVQPSLDEIWAELDTRIRWSERAASIALFFSDAAAPVKRLREMTAQALSYHTMSLRRLQFDDAAALPEALMQALFSAPDGTDLALGAIQTWPLWIELYNGLGPEWDKARHDCLRTLNSSRNQMLEHTSKLVAIVLPLSWHRRVQEIAPDLFSVRSMMVDLPIEAQDLSSISDTPLAWQKDLLTKYDAEAITPSEEERILRAEYERLKSLGKLPGFELAQRLGERIDQRGDFYAGRVLFSEILERKHEGISESLNCLSLYRCAHFSLVTGDLETARKRIDQLLSEPQQIIGKSAQDQLTIQFFFAGAFILASKIYQEFGDSAKAADMLKASDRLFQNLPSNHQTGQLQIIGLLHASTNITYGNEQRLRFTEQAVLLARAGFSPAKVESAQLLSECLFALGKAKMICGSVPDAALYFIECLEIMAELDPIPKMVANQGSVLATLAKAALAIDQSTMAAESLEKAVECFLRVDAVVGKQNRQWLKLLHAYLDLARLQIALKRHGLAKKNCEAALGYIATLTSSEQRSVEKLRVELEKLLLATQNASNPQG